MNAFLCDAVRTPFGRYGGELSGVRPDDLAAIVLRALIERNPDVDWAAVDDVVFGCANQAGEDNRNVARMALLLAGLPVEVTGTTINRLCGSSLDATAIGARAIKSGECGLVIAGGVESMSRAPFVVSKSETAFGRNLALHDTTIGWRFVNPLLQEKYGIDSMPETGENVAEEFQVSRSDQDAFALRSHQRWARAHAAGFFQNQVVQVSVPRKKGEIRKVVQDEHPRPDTSLEALAKLKPVVRTNGTVTAGNASGINDGASALLIASEEMVRRFGFNPLCRIVGAATAGIAPRIMGFAPALAAKKLLERLKIRLSDIENIELNEAFAAQVLAVTRDLGLPDEAEHLNPNGGAIAIGHPLGASGARLVATAAYQMKRIGARYSLCTMCIGVGQGIALLLERTA
jgi:acetyl-CoA acyltransferase